ncbi:hypothetical protein ILUMI_11159, partial [Ignelater luminosus]
IDLNKLRVFGEIVHVHIPKQKRLKWDSKSKKGLFVGYPECSKGYRVYFPSENKIDIVRDVIFGKEQNKDLGVKENNENTRKCVSLNYDNYEYQESEEEKEDQAFREKNIEFREEEKRQESEEEEKRQESEEEKQRQESEKEKRQESEEEEKQPMDEENFENYNLRNRRNIKKPERYLCRKVIGSVIYAATTTRPDLSAAMSYLSRYQDYGNNDIWICLKRVLRYIKGSINLKLTYHRNEDAQSLEGYADSDWGSNLVDQCLWLKEILNDLFIQIKNPIIIHEDNIGCIHIINNPEKHQRTKHIDIKHHFIREKVANGEVKLKKTPSNEQLADIMTKALTKEKIEKNRSLLGLL